MLSNTFPTESEGFSVISIVGPTGVGKSEVSWQLADMLVQSGHASGCDLISVDSKQVYKDLEVLSGADIPADSKKIFDVRGNPIYQRGQHVLHGVAMLEAYQSWSVAQFQQFAAPIIEKARLSQRKVILVGGTGLYHERLWERDPQLRVPRNDQLRAELEVLSVEQLQQRLISLDKQRFEQMNYSDRLNPRRLQRAIEISCAQAVDAAPNPHEAYPIAHEYLGLIAPDDVLKAKIKARVKQRFEQGALEEVKHLLQLPDVSEQVSAAIGFSQLQQYVEGMISLDGCLTSWAQAEWRYVTRQLTWWRKKHVEWHDVHEEGIQMKLESFLSNKKHQYLTN